MSRGRFGVHGGQYMSETLMNELLNLEKQYNHFKEDPEFVEELNTLLKEYAGRPSLLYYAKRMIEKDYQPDGFNIGINDGESAGQTIMHLHIHMIPRYKGDTENPRGGVRGVIPNKQNYGSI